MKWLNAWSKLQNQPGWLMGFLEALFLCNLPELMQGGTWVIIALGGAAVVFVVMIWLEVKTAELDARLAELRQESWRELRKLKQDED